MQPINIHFTKLVKAKQLMREFNFRKLSSTVYDQLYHVDVSDDRGNRIVFKISKDNTGTWKILDEGLPPWIYEAESQLGHAIEEGADEIK